MIQLNVDFSLLTKFFGLSTSKVSQYANKSFEEIMELEAQQGNKLAENYKQILSNPQKIKEIFKLANVENKYIILENMSEHDKDNLLPYLNQEQLTNGLYYFTEEKLLSMAQELPVEALIPMIFSKFNMFDVLKYMEDSDMNNFLNEAKVERKYSRNYFESLRTKDLQDLMIKQFGLEYEDKTKEECLEQLDLLDNSDYKQFLFNFDKKDKMNLINGIVGQEDNLLTLFDSYTLTRPMTSLMQNDMVELMGVLDPEFLIPMIQELPENLTQVVLTQIDADLFSEILTDDYQDILKDIVLFQSS